MTLKAQSNNYNMLQLKKQKEPLHVYLCTLTEYRLYFWGGLQLGTGTNDGAFHVYLPTAPITDVNFRHVGLLTNTLITNAITSAAFATGWTAVCTEVAAAICVFKTCSMVTVTQPSP